MMLTPSSFDNRDVGKAECQRESQVNMSQVHCLKGPGPTVYTLEMQCQGTKDVLYKSASQTHCVYFYVVLNKPER